MAMNSVEQKNFVRDTAAKSFIDYFPNARAIDGKDYTFIIPVDVEGVTMYAKFGITSLATAATKTREAFDVDEQTTPALEAFDAMLTRREEDRKAKEAERAAKAKKA